MTVESLDVCFSQETSRQSAPCVQERCLEKGSFIAAKVSVISFCFASHRHIICLVEFFILCLPLGFNS